jgi:KipI family sensor histidine kinase inhibitor
MRPSAHILTASDRALLVVFDDAITEQAGRDVRLLEAWLREEPPAAVVDLNPAYASLLVRFDPLRCDPDALAFELARRTAALAGRKEREARSFTIPVAYGGEDGLDLPEVARATGLSEAEVVAAHSSGPYEVRFIGFAPGFPYLAGLPDVLLTPRRKTPRARVAAGSVAIAGAQAGIYPFASPAGWNVIGRTTFVLFGRAPGEGATLAAGDRVRFLPVERLP